MSFYLWRSIAGLLQLETLSEQRRKLKVCRTCFMKVTKYIYGNDKPMPHIFL